MIKNQDLVVFSDDWGRHPFSCMHIMKHFQPYNKILWVNTVGMRKPRPTLYDLKRSIEKVSSWFGRSTSNETIPINLKVVSPVMLPFNNISNIRSFNKKSVISTVKREMKDLEIKQPILLTTLPTAIDYLGAFNEMVDVYYCVDEYSKWPGATREILEEMEAELIRKADAIVTTSDELKRAKISKYCSTYLLTHGVDIEHFRKTKDLSPHPLFRRIRKPVIGYFGLIDGHVDLELLQYLIKNKPEWSFIFIGPVKVDLYGLKQYRNAHFNPPVPYINLPQYLAGLDVCILPYRVNELTRNSNPLKLKECLAAGKPVVSTALPEIAKLGEAIRIGWSKEGFINMISEALKNPFDQSATERVLEGQDWSFKAERMSQFIEEAIRRKNSLIHHMG